MPHSWRRALSWFAALAILSGAAHAAETNTNAVVRSESDKLLDQANAAWLSQQKEEAIVLATRAIEANTNELRSWSVRGWFYSETGQPEKAVADFTEVMRINPRNVAAWRIRGTEYFKLGRFAESVADFDQFSNLAPQEAAQYWPRGIVAFHAGKYTEAFELFQAYRQRDTNDVEVVVWQFLCEAKRRGLERARLALPRVDTDPRVPMAEILRMFSGRLEPAEVLRVAAIDTVVPPQNAAEKLNRQMFYAHFYVGLHYEALGKLPEASEHVQQAAVIYRVPDLMGDIARVHANRLRQELEKSSGQPKPNP